VVVALEYLDLVVLESWGSIKSVRETIDLVIALRARSLPYLLHLLSQTLLPEANLQAFQLVFFVCCDFCRKLEAENNHVWPISGLL
jgi:hypothetical protein